MLVGQAPELRLPSPLVELVDDRLESVRVLLKRDDLIHPDLSGNKWRKLKYLLVEAQQVGASALLTFGGAYSNHVRAVAAAGRWLGIPTIGVIRGDERPSNPQLMAAEADGMRLHYVDRTTYRQKADSVLLEELHRRFGDYFLVPEGGTTVHAVTGCIELVQEIDRPFDLILSAVGTGGTLAGIAAGLPPDSTALGISSLRGAASLDHDVAALHAAALGAQLENWTIDHRFHHGGFARRSFELDRFLSDFHQRHGLQLDHVYVGKMMFALFALVENREIPAGAVVVALITGGVSSLDRSDRAARSRT